MPVSPILLCVVSYNGAFGSATDGLGRHGKRRQPQLTRRQRSVQGSALIDTAAKFTGAKVAYRAQIRVAARVTYTPQFVAENKTCLLAISPRYRHKRTSAATDIANRQQWSAHYQRQAKHNQVTQPSNTPVAIAIYYRLAAIHRGLWAAAKSAPLPPWRIAIRCRHTMHTYCHRHILSPGRHTSRAMRCRHIGYNVAIPCTPTAIATYCHLAAIHRMQCAAAT
jgi:hypothetical protein